MKSKAPKHITTFPVDLEHKLEFDQLRQLLAELCVSDLGSNEVQKICFYTSISKISELLRETSEFKYILNKGYSFPITHYLDLSSSLKILSIDDSTLGAESFQQLGQVLTTIQKIFAFFKKYKEELPCLSQMLEDAEWEPVLLKKIETIIGDDGEIRDNASKALAEIRKKIKKGQAEMERIFIRVLKHCRTNKWLQDEEQSVRRGDQVLAIESKYKRKVKGLILDESSTGKTTFIQPEEVVQLNYKLYAYFQEEKKEIERILRELSDFFRPHLPPLLHYQYLLGRFDCIRAKAKLAIQLKADAPKLVEQQQSELIQAFHPLLYLKNLEKGKKTIPLDLKLDPDHRMLIISGPNAGGKSVCLKTVGLLQLMLQAGLLIPLHPNSCMGIYDHMFVDIGDNQSIDNELSTYTSKLSNMKYFLEHSTSNTLILLDEFGAGTDPQIGGIIAECMLEELNQRSVLGVITTHYTNLKIFASENEGVINGAMLFDLENYSPTYQLEIGRPGSSYAFELVQKIGFELNFTERIQGKIKEDQLMLDSLLVKLQEEKKDLEKQQLDLKKQKNQADKLLEENIRFKQEIAIKKNEIIHDAKLKAQRYIERMNQQFDKLQKQWQDEKNDEKKAAKLKTAREKLRQEQEIIQKRLKKKQIPAKKQLKKIKIKVVAGQQVVLDDREEVGFVESVDKNKAVVIFGNIRAKVELGRLQVIDTDPAKQTVDKTRIIRSGERAQAFKPVLDLRGQRREEAVNLTEKFLDDALLSHFKSLKIIHGYGDGILKNAIRDTLKKYNFIIEVKSESFQYGGDGVTLVELE